jgi:hypothetical protein
MAQPRKSRKAKPEVLDAVVVGMSETVVADDSGTAALDALLADLNAGEVVETPIETIAEEHTDEELAAAVGSAEASEVMIAAATPEGIVEGSAAVPTGDASDVTPADAAPAEAGKPAKVRTPRKHYTDKVERLKDRVGDELSSYTVLTLSEAGVTEDDVKAAMDATLDIIRKMNKKEQNRAGFLIEFLAGKKAKLNEVLHRTLDVLKAEGCITTGKEGNVFKNLLARPYSAAAARAMGGNTVAMFADLKLIVADGKQRFVANPDSTLLAAVRGKLDAIASAGAAA